MSKQQEEMFWGLMVCFKHDSDWEQFSWKPLRTVPKLIVKSSREQKQTENQLKKRGEKKINKNITNSFGNRIFPSRLYISPEQFNRNIFCHGAIIKKLLSQSVTDRCY